MVCILWWYKLCQECKLLSTYLVLAKTVNKLLSQHIKLNHSFLHPLPRAFGPTACYSELSSEPHHAFTYIPSSPFHAVYLILRLLFSSFQMLMGSVRHLPIPLHLRPGCDEPLSVFDLITGQIPFTPSGPINCHVLHAYCWFTVTDRASFHHIPSIWQRSFSIASAVASLSCGSSSPPGTESGLGRSDRQLSEEHSSAAPCCCLYRWWSTRNCSSGTVARKKTDEKRMMKAKLEGWEEQVLWGNFGGRRPCTAGKWYEMKAANGSAAHVKGEGN